MIGTIKSKLHEMNEKVNAGEHIDASSSKPFSSWRDIVDRHIIKGEVYRFGVGTVPFWTSCPAIEDYFSTFEKAGYKVIKEAPMNHEGQYNASISGDLSVVFPYRRAEKELADLFIKALNVYAAIPLECVDNEFGIISRVEEIITHYMPQVRLLDNREYLFRCRGHDLTEDEKRDFICFINTEKI